METDLERQRWERQTEMRRGCEPGGDSRQGPAGLEYWAGGDGGSLGSHSSFAPQGGDDLDPNYVFSSRVRTGRSIKGYSLPPHCSRGERRAVEKLSVDGETPPPRGSPIMASPEAGPYSSWNPVFQKLGRFRSSRGAVKIWGGLRAG